MNDESGPPTGRLATTTLNRNHLRRDEGHRLGPSPVEKAKAGLGDMRSLLSRHGIQVKGRSLRCPSPDHVDRHPSASIYTAADGDERVRCWSCGFDEDTIGVARALGEHVDFSGPNTQRYRPPARRHAPASIPLDIAKQLLEAGDELAFTWRTAALLAELPPRSARLEILRNWTYLAERLDIELLLKTTALIRGTAMLRFCTAKTVRDPGAIPRAVRRLIEEAEHAR